MSLTLEWQHRIMDWRHELSQTLYQVVSPMSLNAAFTKRQLRLAEALKTLSFEPVMPETVWGAKWEYGWFTSEIILPEIVAGQMILAMPDVGADAVVYINGDYAGAIDEHHKGIILKDLAVAGGKFNLVLEAYAGHGPREWRSGPTPPDRDTVPEPPEAQCKVGQSHFGIWHEVAFQLAMDVETLWEVRENIDQDSLRVMEIDEGLKNFTLLADFEAPTGDMLQSLQRARERLKPLLEKKNGDTTPEMIGFGHAHIDVAWMWPMVETERKCVRTFSTQLALMDRYPEYKFLQSQPQLYVMVKQKYPDLYEKILAAIKRGQWIPDGAAWVEPDTNIPSGESLIRQMIHGLRFYQQELGVQSEMLWLPDVFGYSGALPQIMRGCDLRFFSTHKIFWAYHGGEPFPYNTFIWEGIDGSQVYAHFHNDYNSETKPSIVIERWKERVQKDGFSSRLFPFGHGDGGGGPTREHLEYARRQKNLEGVPKFRIDAPITYFHEQEAVGWPSARYVGELYFQAHRGTYTSQAKTKALNRCSEFALREAELWGAVAMHLGDYQFPFKSWEALWKTLLLNQFHDILPGSSIQRVYEEAEAQLSEVVDGAKTIADAAMNALIDEPKGLTFFNSLSWERNELVELPQDVHGLQSSAGEDLPIQEQSGKRFTEVCVLACGWKVFQPGQPGNLENSIHVEEHVIENNFMRVEFNEYGEISRIFDKALHKAINAGTCNSLKMYQDIPSAFDAWDIDSMARLSPVALPEKAVFEVQGQGPLFGSLVIRRKLNQSFITQEIRLRRDSRRMDFHTVIDWQERHKLLKVSFPVAYHTREALHEIQFGHLARPTHRSREIDRDRFEVVNHKWTALVEPAQGFALLNDSKYGVDVLDNTISLTLLKSALAPDMTADRGRQEFTYAFYFWDGPFIESDLILEAYQLNVPLQMARGCVGERTLFELDKANIILETIKPAEDGCKTDLILRLYEAMGTHTTVTLNTSLSIKEAFQVNMLEQIQQKVAMTGNRLQLKFKPFEIITLRLRF
ncbi:MAG: alpha-mannosidase [Anaerolineales bacterium]